MLTDLMVWLIVLGLEKYFLEEFGYFTSHGQDSLSRRNRSNEFTQSQKLFVAIKDVANYQLIKENNSDQLAVQKQEIARWKAAAEAQATFVTRALMEKCELEKQIAQLKRAFEESKRVAADQLASKDELIAELTQKIYEIKGFKGLDGGVR